MGVPAGEVPTSPAASPAPPGTTADPAALLRSASYVRLLVLAALLGIPVSALAYAFLALVEKAQTWIFTDLWSRLGYGTEPVWWPVPPLLLAGLLVALAIRYLPGTGGHPPSAGLAARGVPSASELPGVLLAALATLCLGAVLGPEAPLIALGGGLAAWVVTLSRREVAPQAAIVVGSAGSFAAISTLLGSPVVGAFLLMEAAGLGGPTLGLVLLPGLVAAGVGSLIFIGLDAWTGLGTFSLAIPNLPPYDRPDAGQLAWAVAIGVGAAVVGTAIRRGAVLGESRIARRRLLVTPVLGLAVAGLAIAYGQLADKSSSEVLFSGQSALGPLIENSADYSVGALLLLFACKVLAYTASLVGFRGGPVFPAMFVGAVAGIALSHLPGLPVVAGVAMGIGAMSAVMLQLPLTSVLLASLLLGSDGLAVMPVVIIAVAVAYVAAARLAPDRGERRGADPVGQR